MNLIQAPDLDIDKVLFERHTMTHRHRQERAAVANLIHHLALKGWSLVSVYDGEENTKVSSMKEAMELIFNLDVSWLRVRKGLGKVHVIFLVLGNSGAEVVCDHSAPQGEHDEGFGTVMDSFDFEAFA